MIADATWARRQLQRVQQRMRTGKPADRMLQQVDQRLRASVARASERADAAITIDYPSALPVGALRDEVIGALRERGVLVLTGETGSGKTTQLPKMLLEAGCGRRGTIAVTQPRRVAAVSVAERIAEEMQAPAPLIAHAVRFDDRSDASTLVRIATDGLLLAEAAADPDLSRYDAVVVDEAHERSLNIDVLLGMLRTLRSRRPDLVVVVTSATIDAERIAEYLGDERGAAPMLHATGRTFPVTIEYRDPGDNDLGYLGAAVAAVEEVHTAPQSDEAATSGDVLVFLPTERDIIEASRRLGDSAVRRCYRCTAA